MSDTPYSALRYNQVRQKASHNSYQRSEGLADQIVYWRLRGVEFDIHNGNDSGRWPPIAQDWYVYHLSVADQGSSVRRFSDGLALLQGFHAAVPDHEVMTVALDLKDDFDDQHTPEDLDALIRKYLGDAVFMPADLGAGRSDLQAGVKAGGWPRLADLRGKFIFICTTGDLADPRSHLNQYVQNGSTANVRVCFVAPQISRESQISLKNYAVFFNMSVSNVGTLSQAVFNSGFIARSYSSDEGSSWSRAVSGKVHIIATGKVNADEDPWARTDNALGWPFAGIDVTVDPGTTEPGAVVGLEVRSGDIWGSADSFGFNYRDCGDSPDGTVVYAVAVPGSHVNAWAKAGLMARTSLTPGAANFSVLRPAAANPVRVQVRARDAGSTSATELSTAQSIADSGWMLLRLTVSGGGTMAQGEVSFDGVHWTSLGRQSFASPLRYQGLAVSAHDTGTAIRFLALPVGAQARLSGQAGVGDRAQLTVFAGASIGSPNAAPPVT